MKHSFKPRVEMLEDRLVMSGTTVPSVTDFVLDCFDPAPPRTGQVAVVREAPSSDGRILFGTDGGVWKSKNGGQTWQPLFDAPSSEGWQPEGWFSEGPAPINKNAAPSLSAAAHADSIWIDLEHPIMSVPDGRRG